MIGKIYTRKGDQGKTSTLRGQVSKADEIAETLGTIDELNSWIGVCQSKVTNHKSQITNQIQIDDELKRIQTNLMTINTTIAGGDLAFKIYEVRHLEKLIDKLQEELPLLKNFIYPVGELQYARALARKAERRAVSNLNNQITNNKLQKNNKSQVTNYKCINKYLNRLSDALFVMGRWENFQKGVKEEIW